MSAAALAAVAPAPGFDPGYEDAFVSRQRPLSSRGRRRLLPPPLWQLLLAVATVLLALAPLAAAQPTVLLLSPVTGITGVGLLEQLTMTFSESVNVISGGGNITIYTASTQTAYETFSCAGSLVAGNGTATILASPQVARAENTVYYVNVAADCFLGRTTGLAFAGIQTVSTWRWTTADFTSPSLVSVVPANNATNVDGSAVLKATFNEPVRAMPGSTAQIRVLRVSDNEILCGIACAAGSGFQGAGTTQLTFSCTTALPDLTKVFVDIPALCISDMSGNAFDPSLAPAWGFTTGDYTAPLLTSRTPQNLATNVPLTQVFALGFNEVVYAGTGALELRRVSDNSVVLSVDAASSAIQGWGTAQLQLTPTASMPDGTRLLVQIPATAIKDANGNFFAGTSGSAWTFTTVDLSPPKVSTLTPANGAVGVALLGDLVVLFDEPVLRASSPGSITIRNYATDAILQTIPVSTSSVQGWNTAILRITPPGLLPDSTQVYVLLPSASIIDVSGNVFPGLLSKSDWSFTTGDFTPPQVVVYVPAFNAVNVDPAAALGLTFNEPVVVTLSRLITIRRSNDSTLLSTTNTSLAAITGNGTTTITVPHDTLPSLTKVFVEIPSPTFYDLAGNAFIGVGLGSGVTWTFTTSDYAAPVVLSLAPALLQREVPVASLLVMTFDKPVVAAAGGQVNIWGLPLVYESWRADATLSQLLYSFAITNTSVVTTDAAAATVTFTPPTALPTDTIVAVLITQGALKDTTTNANPFAGYQDFKHWNFSTIDTLPPVIVSLIPVNASLGAYPNASLVLTFNEPVQTFAAGTLTIYRASDNTALRSFVMSSPAITGSGTYSLTVAMTATPLPINTLVYCLISPTAIADLATAVGPNYFPGFTTSTGWTWTTGDWYPPVVTALSPPHLSTGAAVTVQPAVTFNETVIMGSGLISIYLYAKIGRAHV